MTKHSSENSAFSQDGLPQNSDWYTFGRIMLTQGDPVKAREAFTRYEAMNPSQPIAAIDWAVLACREGNVAEALSRVRNKEKLYLPRLVENLRGAGHDDAASTLIQKYGASVDNPLLAGALLVQHTLVPEREVDGLLDSYDFQKDLRGLLKEILVAKAAFYERTKLFDYKMISLGYDCYPAILLSRWGLGFVAPSSSKRLPFDLAQHGNEVWRVLNSGFKGYSDSNNILQTIYDKQHFFQSRKYQISFNHDPVVKFFKDTDRFAATLKERVDNFHEIILKQPVLFFHYHNKKSVLSDTMESAANFLSKYDMPHKLFILADDEENSVCTCNDITVLKSKIPANFAGRNVPDTFLSNEYVTFEKNIINAIARIIEENFPRKSSQIISIEDAQKNIEKKVLHEIAEEYNVKEYIKNLQAETYIPGMDRHTDARRETVGAIVMNCNPFTLGHRYLIEQASAKVDKLIIFVVEENLSHFTFEDRYTLVKAGTADLHNVVVVRSGKFVISTATFPSYFTKDNPDLATVDASTDVSFFGEYIAPALNITTRFVGTEPSCQITNAYNRQMAAMLPQYGINVEEIPRLELKGQAISASIVRACLEAGQLEKVRELVPSTTYEYLLKTNTPVV